MMPIFNEKKDREMHKELGTLIGTVVKHWKVSQKDFAEHFPLIYELYQQLEKVIN